MYNTSLLNNPWRFLWCIGIVPHYVNISSFVVFAIMASAELAMSFLLLLGFSIRRAGVL